eukprot:jgi/Tetstr1/438025/TSEL_026652.t1
MATPVMGFPSRHARKSVSASRASIGEVNVAQRKASIPRHANHRQQDADKAWPRPSRRQAIAAVVLAASGGVGGSKGAEAQSTAADRAKAGADAVKKQQDEAIAKAKAQQAVDLAKAEKDQAALKAFLMKLFGFGK